MSKYAYPDKNDLNFLTNIITSDWEDGGLEEAYINECIEHLLIKERNIVKIQRTEEVGPLVEIPPPWINPWVE
jgi:pyruvate-formate lyase